MDYVNYYITILLFFTIRKCTAITNIGSSSSIPKDFKRHIGLAPPTNWEPGLREATNQALMKEQVVSKHLRDKIMHAPMSGHGAKVSPFGDVAILARGQLFANPTGFRFVQDPYPNDCIDCHELRQCYGKECEIYLKNGLGERLIALWTVKRLRHRDPDVRYELEYTISPIRKHVWVTKNGGYDYSIPGHVFVVKTASNYNKYNDQLPHYPHPPVPNHHKEHHKPPGYLPKPHQWVPINAPPPLLSPPPVLDKIPNYYLPQKPIDQTASTTQKDLKPTLDYKEIEAYNQLLQVLHQKTSTTDHRFKPTKETTQQMRETTKAPALSHTTWYIPVTKFTKPTSKMTTVQVTSTEPPKTTKSIEQTKATISLEPAYITKPTLGSTKPSSAKPLSTEISAVQTTATQRTKTTTSDLTKPTSFLTTLQSMTHVTQPMKLSTIYQQLGGFDSSKPSTLPIPTFAPQRNQTQTMVYPMRTTIPVSAIPTQPSITIPFSQAQTSGLTITQPMTSIRTTKPTQPMTSLITKPMIMLTKPPDGQTTSTFLFSTKITPPFALTKPMKTTIPTRYPTTGLQNTIPINLNGKPTTFGTNYFPGKTEYLDMKTTIPMRRPTIGTTFPVSTIIGTTYPGTSIGPMTTFVVPGTQTGSSIFTTSKYPTTQQYPTTNIFTNPTIISTSKTTSTIGAQENTYGTTSGNETPSSQPPTGLAETTKATQPSSTQSYKPPIPTFYIDPTHPGYPKTTPTTPFTDGETFRPSQPDPTYHQLPTLTIPTTSFSTPTRPTCTDETTHTRPTSSNSGTTLHIPSTTPDRYFPPTSSHTIYLPTKLPKPSTPFKPPAVDDYDVELFPGGPIKPETTTTTQSTSTFPPGTFLLPEGDYTPQPIIPDINAPDVDVFDKLPSTTSTTQSPTSTINPEEIKEVFDSSTFKPKPLINESEFDEFFKQELPTTTFSTLDGTAAKVIYSDFFEASTAPPSVNFGSFTTIPSTSQSFSTSVSVQVSNSKNGNGRPKVVKKLKFRKAKVKELPQTANGYRVYKAENTDDDNLHKQQEITDDVEIVNHDKTKISKYGKLKATSTVSTSHTGVTKAFDDLALQLVNHARTIDYLDGKKEKVSRNGNASSTSRNPKAKYKRKSYGRVRKVKKRPENRATITRSTRGNKSSKTKEQSTVTPIGNKET